MYNGVLIHDNVELPKRTTASLLAEGLSWTSPCIAAPASLP